MMTDIKNNIAEKQNQVMQLDRLAAQREIYSNSKTLQAIQIALMVVIPVAGSWMALANSSVPVIKMWVAFYSIVVSLVDAAVIDQVRMSFQETAAKIQEVFDCDVLGIPWSDLKTGNRPDPECITAAADRYVRKHNDCKSLENWYPPSIQQLPIDYARLVAQRANCQWDALLRHKFKNWLLGIMIAVIVMLSTIGLIGGFTLERLVLSVIAPLSPALLWGIREYRRQHEAAGISDRLKTHIDKFWLDLVKNGQSEAQAVSVSRQLQDTIYERRKGNSQVFDWVYNRLRTSQERQMNKAAEQLVEEALAALANHEQAS